MICAAKGYKAPGKGRIFHRLDEGWVLLGGAESSRDGTACCSQSCSVHSDSRRRNSLTQHLRSDIAFWRNLMESFSKKPWSLPMFVLLQFFQLSWRDRIGQDLVSVTELSQVAKKHLILTENLFFPQVIILIRYFFLLIHYFLPKNHIHIDWNYSNLCWEHHIILTETIYIF